MKVIKINPRGYCHGVVYAMKLVSETISNPNTKKPIYILGQIVHNHIITEAFQEFGVTTLTGGSREELLDKVNEGTIIITAHGIAPNLLEKARNKGLNVVDATCSDVYKTHNLIKDKISEGYDIVYIGKRNHPEPEGIIGINSSVIHLVEQENDILKLGIKNNKILVTNQTTMSIWDTKILVDKVIEKFPTAEKMEEICSATQERQEAVVKMASEADLTIVVGDPKSNNTNRLVEISKKIAKTEAVRIESIEDLNINLFLEGNIECVAVTAGASTPSLITKEVCNFLEQFDKKNKETWITISKIDKSRIIPRIK